MSVDIQGMISLTLTDWPGKTAAALFLGGCNFRCSFCHNPELIEARRETGLPTGKVIERLTGELKWIDGVVIGGGEPCLAGSALTQLILAIKKATGLAVKVDTNGSRPEVLRELLDAADGPLDMVSMDIKVPLADYGMVVAEGRAEDVRERVRNSIELLLSSGIDHEFRTTVFPGYLDRGAVRRIAQSLAELGVHKLVLQQFDPGKTLTTEAARVQPYTDEELGELVKVSSRFLETSARIGA